MLNILDNQKKTIKGLAKRFDLAFLVLFGSQATGQTHPQSDLDIGYLAIPKDLDYSQAFYLQSELINIFPKFTIDLVNLRRAPILLRHRAAFTGQLIVEYQPHSFTRFQMATYLNYLETKSLRNLRARYLEHKIKQYA